MNNKEFRIQKLCQRVLNSFLASVGSDQDPTVCHSESVPESFFEKVDFEKSQQMTTIASKVNHFA